MKKLMFGIAAVSAGICLADVTSANVVGYQNKVINKQGFNYVGGTFERVDGETLSLADVSKNDQFTCDNPDLLFFLDDGGGTRVRKDGYLAQYSYFTKADYDAPADGWYVYDAIANDGTWLAPEEEDDFSYGAGAVVTTINKEAALIFSGAVHKGAPTIIISKIGFNFVGNPTPCDLTLSDVTPNDIFTCDNPDLLFFLDDGGGTKVRKDGYLSQYSYFTKDGFDAPADGWYIYDAIANDGIWVGPDEEDNNLTAGTAFVVTTISKEAGLQFKAALPADAE